MTSSQTIAQAPSYSAMQKISQFFFLSSGESKTINYVFIMIFLFLALGYFLILLMSGYRIKKVINRVHCLVVAKVFYILIMILCLFRVFSSILIIIESYNYNSSQEEENQLTELLYNALYISDAVFGLMFFNLFWYLIIYYYKSHVRIGNVLFDGRNPAASIKGMNVYKILSAFYILIHLIYVSLYNLTLISHILDSTQYLFGSSINNMLCIAYYFIGINILKCKFSGTPSRSSKLKKEMNHLEKMGLFWVFGRVCATILDIYISINSETIQQLIVGNQTNKGIFWSVIIYFILPANQIISELVPLIYSLLLESVNIFSKSPFSTEPLLEDDQMSSGTSNSIRMEREETININPESNKATQSFMSEHERGYISKIEISNKSGGIKIISEKSRKKGLGVIQKVQIPKRKTDQNISNELSSDNQELYQTFASRVLPMDSLSSWILDSMNQDLRQLKVLNLKHVSKVKRIATDGKGQVFLVTNYFQEGSLLDKNINLAANSNNSSIRVSYLSDSALKQDNKKPQGQGNQVGKNNKESLQTNIIDSIQGGVRGINQQSNLDSFSSVEIRFSYQTKMKIAIQIAKTFAKLHKIGIFHGHLSSSNILFNSSLDAKITDIGFHSLKALMSFRIGYTNKSYFTAPEHLNEPGLIVRKPTSKSDIYSFAFILFELFIERQAFTNLSLDELKKTIILDNSRPKIPESNLITKEVATIIRYCWLADPKERPEFEVILTNLKRVNNESVDEDKDFLFEEQEQKPSFHDNKLIQDFSKDQYFSSDEENEDDSPSLKMK